MSRILLSAYACEPGRGSEPEVGWLWATELAAAGHKVWVITREANQRTIEIELRRRPRPGLHFEYFDYPQWARRWKRDGHGVYLYYALWQWGAYRLAKKLVTRVRFDCVQHVTFVGLRAPSFMGLLGLRFLLGPVSGGECVPAQLREGMSEAARAREAIRDVANRALQFDPVMRYGFRKAERIFVTTEESLRIVPKEFQDKCEVQLGIGLSPEYLGWTGRGNRERSSVLRLLYAGRLLEWKGVDLAMRAVRLALNAGVGLSLTIVGQGPAEHLLRQLAMELSLDGAVRWVKWIPQTELDEHYYDHDALIFPSLRDSGGMVVLEALAHGLPVICTDLGGPKTIVNYRCGRIVATSGRNAEQVTAGLADAMVELGRDRELLNKLSRAARARAWEFDFQKIVMKIHPLEWVVASSSGDQLSAR